jgi:GNAT superfamily N-acetyltransferase
MQNERELIHQQFDQRPLCDADRTNYGHMLHSAFNTWYWNHGWGRDYFTCTPDEAAIFYDIYNDLNPGCSIAFFDRATGALAGACFYHPREHHVSLGIMAVNPDYFGRGVGRALVNGITQFTDDNKLSSLRLVSSAMNMDSFSLYNRSGLVPRVSYNDMILEVSANGMTHRALGQDRVRNAELGDIEAMAKLEHELSGIIRKADYVYAIENKRGFLSAAVIEDHSGAVSGFAISVKCPALNMIGPCVARSEEDALALVRRQLDTFAGQVPLFLVPMQKRHMVETLYSWGARNIETHLYQVRGSYTECAGVNMPSFLPETG